MVSRSLFKVVHLLFRLCIHSSCHGDALVELGFVFKARSRVYLNVFRAPSAGACRQKNRGRGCLSGCSGSSSGRG